MAAGAAMLALASPARPEIQPERTGVPLPAANAAPVPEDIPVALLVDLTNGQILFEREADRRFMPASVTKVMTVYTAFKLIDAGQLRLDMPFRYTQELEDAWYAEGSNMFLRANDRPTIAQLLLGITTVSGNDASVAMAVAAAGSLDRWLELMNENAAELGMQNTHFGSPNGYPDGGQTYTSARDLALLGEAVTQRYPALYHRFFGHRTLTWGDITQGNHDPVTGRVPGADGLKTGFTNEAGYTFLGSARRGDTRLVMVLAGSPTARERDTAARALLEWGFEAFDRRTIVPAGAKVARARVQDGAEDAVPLEPASDVVVALPRGMRPDRYALELTYRGPVEAPVAKGQPVARLRLSIDGRPTLDLPLEAGEAVPRANPLQRVVNAVESWLT
ncbi:D-alanyl-D-alanine carboxypeptidase [Aurantiacibacter spongiae]|uniref:serine-type D-Ala-D-Ala carboxypeptidase n=2 Tax=Aurantiacibacter spongiae TaxID=2488860 RepID=A0A3N5CTR6_9SPHN|nr:D-alanyl-D-alanine carboxypeptidase [Aurantiacibacter spongiae]